MKSKLINVPVARTVPMPSENLFKVKSCQADVFAKSIEKGKNLEENGFTMGINDISIKTFVNKIRDQCDSNSTESDKDVKHA